MRREAADETGYGEANESEGEIMPKTYRASAAPLYSTCPGAAYDEMDEVLIDPVDDYGKMGDAVHEACAYMVLSGRLDLGSIGQDFDLNAAQMKELEILYAVACKFWGEYGGQFRDCHVEVEMAKGDITGHADVLGVTDDGLVRILDWKTTRLQAVNYKPQMMEYLWLAGEAYGHDRYQYTICFLRDKTIEVSKEFTAAEVCQCHAEYVAGVENWDGRTYHPGGHCGYCPRRATCPGLCSELALLCDGFHLVEAAVAELPAEIKVELWERIGSAQKLLEHAREIIKLHAEAAGGTLQGDGKALVLREQQRQTIKAREAWPVVLNHLTEAELAPAVTINKTALLDAVADKAPRGGKKRAKDMLMDALTAADAVETTPYMVPRIVAALPTAAETTLSESEE